MRNKKEKKENQEAPKKKLKKSVGKTLLLILLPLVAWGMASIILFLNHKATKTISATAMMDLQAETNANAQSIATPLQMLKSCYNTYADTMEVVDFASHDQMQKYIAYSLKGQPVKNSGIYLCFEKGGAIFADGTILPDDFDASTKSWYQAAEGKSDKSFITSEVYKDSLGRGSCVTFARRLTFTDQSKGVLGTDVFMKDLQKEVSSLRPMKSGTSAILSNDQIIACPDASLNGKKISEANNSFLSALSEFGQSEKNEVIELKDEKGRVVYVAKTKIPETDWVIFSSVPQKDVQADAIRFRNAALLYMLIILAVILGAITITIRRIISRPIRRLSDGIVRVSEGDFTTTLSIDRADEIGLISSEITSYVDQMRGTLKTIRDRVDKLKNNSTTSMESATFMASRAEEQSTSMEQIHKAVDEIAKAVTVLADSAQGLAHSMDELTNMGHGTNEIMVKLVDQANLGQKDMLQVEEEMNHITDSMNSMNEVVGIVRTSADKINEMVSMIDSISEQTNLLSLNASIEAARAGEAGKGFAVVAGEIGSLAANSRNAAKKITEIVAQITGEIGSLSEQSKSNMAAIEQSGDAVKKTGQSFHSIVEELNTAAATLDDMIVRMREVNEIAVNVASISEEQSASTAEVTTTAENLASSAEGIAKTSKDVEDVASSLSESATQISEALEKFKID